MLRRWFNYWSFNFGPTTRGVAVLSQRSHCCILAVGYYALPVGVVGTCFAAAEDPVYCYTVVQQLKLVVQTGLGQELLRTLDGIQETH